MEKLCFRFKRVFFVNSLWWNQWSRESVVQLGIWDHPSHYQPHPTPVFVVFFLIPSSCYPVIVHYSKNLLNRENKITLSTFSFFFEIQRVKWFDFTSKNFSRPFFPFFFCLNLNSSLSFCIFQNRLWIFLFSEIRQSITHRPFWTFLTLNTHLTCIRLISFVFFRRNIRKVW